MYEFHGWVKLLSSDQEDAAHLHDQKVDVLRCRLQEMRWLSGSAQLLLLNAEHVMLVSAIPNRRRDEADDLRQLIEFVVKEFNAAYGIIYEYDALIKVPSGQGVFSVNVIRRGRCEIHLDPFLTPANPLIEDFE